MPDYHFLSPYILYKYIVYLCSFLSQQQRAHQNLFSDSVVLIFVDYTANGKDITSETRRVKITDKIGFSFPMPFPETTRRKFDCDFPFLIFFTPLKLCELAPSAKSCH